MAGQAMAATARTSGATGSEGATAAPSSRALKALFASQPDVEYGADLVGAIIALIKQINAFRSRLAPTGDFDISQTLLLIQLAENGPARAVELAERICADPSTVSRQVAAMVRSGLIERRADPEDGRASVLVLTEAGRERIARHRQMRGAAMAPLIADWRADDRAAFLRLLSILTSRLDHYRDAMVDAIGARHPEVGRPGKDLR